MNVEEREIKQFSEFDEITPESTQNLITDKGRFTVGTLYNAVLEYIRNLVSEITTQATEESTAVAKSHANTSMLYAEESHTCLEETKASAKLAQTLVINATELGQTKSNRGEFWFNGGTVACSDSWITTDAFSIAWSASVNKSDLPSTLIEWVKTSNNVNSNQGILIRIASNNLALYLHWFDSNNVHHYISQTFTIGTESKPFSWDGNLHTFVYTFNGNGIVFYIDGEVFTSASLSDCASHKALSCTDCPQISHSLPLTFYAPKQKLLRVKAFNFDMSDADAPYTIADYIAGKDESPDVAELTLLSLDDSVSGNGVIDNSINRNNAIVSGVSSSMYKGNRINLHCSNYFSWAGTKTTQKFANSDVAIPANSKVVAYAKANVGMSASFTCGSNSAVSKELSANTLTEIGSFLNASQGAFKVAPSSAITGKMDVYLTIEKF